MRIEAPDARGRPDGTWTFITNHAAALLIIRQQPDVRLSDLASELEITERAAQRVVRDLIDGGYLAVKKQGRRNHYEVTCDAATMRHPVVRSVDLRMLVELIDPPRDRERPGGEPHAVPKGASDDPGSTAHPD